MKRFENHLGENYTPDYLTSLTDEELAAEIKALDYWDIDLVHDLVWRASILDDSIADEWEADETGDEMESIAFKAAKALCVEIA